MFGKKKGAFEKWVEQVEDVIAKRLGKKAHVASDNDGYNERWIRITICDAPIQIRMSFDAVEYAANNYHQRRSLAKVRRLDVARELEDIAKAISSVYKRLQR